jgi:hypothetical protein
MRHHGVATRGATPDATEEEAVNIGKPRRVITVEPEREPVTEPTPAPAEPHEEPVPATPSDHRAGAER